MNGKLLILMVSFVAVTGLSGCASVTCPAEFARPKNRELFCGPGGSVMSTGGETYITPAQYQEWKRQTTVPFVPPNAVPPAAQPMAPLAPSTGKLKAPEEPAGLIEG